MRHGGSYVSLWGSRQLSQADRSSRLSMWSRWRPRRRSFPSGGVDQRLRSPTGSERFQRAARTVIRPSLRHSPGVWRASARGTDRVLPRQRNGTRGRQESPGLVGYRHPKNRNKPAKKNEAARPAPIPQAKPNAEKVREDLRDLRCEEQPRDEGWAAPCPRPAELR